jgi:hypothetical protein
MAVMTRGFAPDNADREEAAVSFGQVTHLRPIRQDDGRTGFLNVNDKLMREWVRPGAKGLVYLFAVLMCCIRSHASFFQTRRPLTVSAPEPTAGSEK